MVHQNLPSSEIQGSIFFVYASRLAIIIKAHLVVF